MIKEILKKMLLSIMLFVFLFTNSSMAAVIITSEKSTDNDEADQQIEIDATTEAIEEQEGEETATIKQKIEKELETQMKEDIANNAKTTINTQIYLNEATILGDIGRAWKEVVKTEITDERAEKIYTVYVENLEEYAGKKIDAWINEYYTNNKDRIVNKVTKYIDGDESMISTAVSTVVYTALDDIESEMEKLVTEINGKIGSIVKDVLNKYEKVSTWEEKAVEAICMEIPIQIGESLNNVFNEKFSWESEKLTEGLSLIETSESTVSKEFSNQTIDYLKNYYASELGYDVDGKSFTELFVEYGTELAMSKMDENWKEICTAVREVVFSQNDINIYNTTFNKIFSEKKDTLTKNLDKLMVSIGEKYKNTATSEIDIKREKKKAQKEYQQELEKAYRETDIEVRAKLEKAANEKYENTIKELNKKKEEIENGLKEELTKEAKETENSIIEYGEDALKNLSVEKLLLQQDNEKLDEQLEKDIEAAKVKWGSKISDEEQKKWDDEIETENKRYNAEIAEIKARGDLTKEEKEQKEINEGKIKAEAAAAQTNLDERYGIKLTPEKEAERDNRIDTAEKNCQSSIDKINTDYDEAIAKAQTSEEKKQLENDRDTAIATAKSELKLEKENIKADYQTGLKEEDKPSYKAEQEEIENKKAAALQANEEAFKKPERTEEEKAKDAADLKTAKENHENNVEKINDSHELPEQTDEQKAREKEEIAALKAKKEEEEKALKQKIKEIREQQKAEVKKIQEQTKQKQEEYDNWRENTYKSEKERLKEAIKNAKTPEEKLKLQQELADLETEKKLKKAELERAKKDLREKELSIVSKEQKIIAEATAKLVASLAVSYAQELISGITEKLDEWADKLGTIAGSVVKAVTAQIGNWVISNIATNVSELIMGAFGFTPNFGFSELKLNMKILRKTIYLQWAMANEALAEIISGYGGVPLKGNLTYEEMAIYPYLFIARSGLTLIPTRTFVSAIATAETMARTYKSSGDIGTDGSNVFGTKERQGYNPLQFLPWGQITVYGTVPPYVFISESIEIRGPLGATITDYAPTPPLYLGGFFCRSVTGGTVTPCMQIYTAPLIGPFWDSAYVATEFANASGNDSYVQRAFTRTSLSQLTGSIAFEQSKYSAALVKEAKKYSSFSQKVLEAGGFSNSLKDLTDEENLKTRYISDSDAFIIGPFKIDYIKSRVETEYRTTDIGFMSDMKIYYMDSETNKQKEIPKDSWQILFSEDGEADLDYSSERYSESYIYPYPKEEFYIYIDKSKNSNITNISKIKMKFKEMQVILAGMLENLTYGLMYNTGNILPIPVSIRRSS